MQSNDKKSEAAQVEQARKASDTKKQSEQPTHERPKLMTPDASRYLREEKGIIVEPRTLANLAWSGRGPPFFKCGGRRYYSPDHLDLWAREQLGEPRRSTSDHTLATKKDQDWSANTKAMSQSAQPGSALPPVPACKPPPPPVPPPPPANKTEPIGLQISALDAALGGNNDR